MVLPRRIELRTSPLPRGCSTTELRQHRGRGPGDQRPKARGWPLASGAEHATTFPVRQPEAPPGKKRRFSSVFGLIRAAVDRPSRSRHVDIMSKPPIPPAKAKPPASPKVPRGEHLAQALRDNLRRRKAQAQARSAKAEGTPEPDAAKE